MTDAEKFSGQCAELGGKVTDLLFSYPKPVAVCVLPGVMAAVVMTLGIPREIFIAMLDSALEDMRGAL